MTALIILIAGFFLYINKVIRKKIPLHILIVNILWAFEAIIVKFNLLKLDGIDNKVYLIIILFLLSFNIVNVLMVGEKKKKNMNRIEISDFNGKYIGRLNMVISVLLLFFLRRIMQYIITGDLNAIRSQIYYQEIGVSNEMFKNGIEVIVLQWITQGLILGSLYISTLGTILNKLNLKMFLWSMLNVLLFTFVTSGRMILLNSTALIFIIISLNWSSLNLNDKVLKFIKRKKNTLKQTLLIIFLIVLLITVFREEASSDGSTVFTELYLYLTAPLFYFSKIITNLNYIRLYGVGSISGLIEIISLTLENLFSMKIETPLRQITAINQVYVNLGGPNNYLYNAITTMFLTAYIDFGIAGPVIYGSIIGAASGRVYNVLQSKKSLFYLFVYSFLNYILLMGAISWELLYPHIWVFILTSIFYFGKVHKNSTFKVGEFK